MRRETTQKDVYWRAKPMSSQPAILVIDDEQPILRAMRTILGQHNYRVITASTGEEGLALAMASAPDVIVLDLGLPDMDGKEVCAQLRAWTQTPVIILSVRDSDREKVSALDQGADDYLTKPFSVDELLARVRVALRHHSLVQGGKSTVIQAGELMIDLANHLVTRKGEEVKLSATAFKLLS
jgi:two-component system KDP operon response regulator KdpE